MKCLGMMELHHRDGTRVLVPAELVGPVREVPGNGAVPPQCRITLKGRSFYEAIDVVETIDDVAAKYAAALAGKAPPPGQGDIERLLLELDRVAEGLSTDDPPEYGLPIYSGDPASGLVRVVRDWLDGRDLAPAPPREPDASWVHEHRYHGALPPEDVP